MDDPNSPIIDFYPTEFEQDMNGKKQEWEAVVKIPFIDESRLLEAMACTFIYATFSATKLSLLRIAREHQLTAEEVLRTSFGTNTKFSYSPSEPKLYPSSWPGFFPDLPRCMCNMEDFDLPTLKGLSLIDGLVDGVSLGKEALAGFPSLKTLPHTAQIGLHGVNVHGTESRNKSMVIYIKNPYEGKKTAEVAAEMIGKRTFINWPFLREGLVVAVSDSHFKHEKISVIPGMPAKIIANP